MSYSQGNTVVSFTTIILLILHFPLLHIYDVSFTEILYFRFMFLYIGDASFVETFSLSLLDIDECLHDNGGCSHACVNSDGSYDCVCPSGYQVVRATRGCVDVNECELLNLCQHGCVNTEGSYRCTCPSGFTLYASAKCQGQSAGGTLPLSSIKLAIICIC